MRRRVGMACGPVLVAFSIIISVQNVPAQGTRAGFPSPEVEDRNIAAVRKSIQEIEATTGGRVRDRYDACVRGEAKDGLNSLEHSLRTAPGITPQRRAELIVEVRQARKRVEANCGPLRDTQESVDRRNLRQVRVAGAPNAPSSVDLRAPQIVVDGSGLGPAVNIPGSVNLRAPQIMVEMSGGGVFANLPSQSYLARELQGSGVQQLNQVTPSGNANGAGATLKTTMNNPALTNSQFYVNFNYFKASASSAGAYDPGANFRLNIPGAEGGASGVSLGGNPLNVVNNIIYSNNIENFGGGGGIRIPFVSTPAGLFLDGGIGVTGNRLNMDQSFSGQIPGFNGNFLYATNVNVNSAQLDLSLGLTQTVPTPGGVIILKGDLRVSPTTISGNGTDRFNFIIPNLADMRSSANLSKSTVDYGYGATLGIVYMLGRPGFRTSGDTVIGGQPSPPVTRDLGVASLFLQAGYESRPGFPVIERDGTNPSRLDFKRADIFSVTGGLTFTISPEPTAATKLDFPSRPTLSIQ